MEMESEIDNNEEIESVKAVEVDSFNNEAKICIVDKTDDSTFGFTLVNDENLKTGVFTNVEEDSAAAKAGITNNQAILEVNGEPTHGFDLDTIISMIKMSGDQFNVKTIAVANYPDRTEAAPESETSTIIEVDEPEDYLEPQESELVSNRPSDVEIPMSMATTAAVTAITMATIKPSEVEIPISTMPENENIKIIKIYKKSGVTCGFSAKMLAGEDIIFCDTVDYESPAFNSGLMVGDQILDFENLQDLVDFVRESEKVVELKVRKIEDFNLNDYDKASEYESLSEDAKTETIQASAISLPQSMMTTVNKPPSEVSLPQSNFTTGTSTKKAVAFQFANEVANQAIIKSRNYTYEASSLEGQSQTVSEIFKRKTNLRKIVPKAAMDLIVEDDHRPENVFVVKKGDKSRMNRLVSEEIDGEVPTNVSVKKPILADDDRSVLNLRLDGEDIPMPKIKKLLGRWQQMQSPTETTPPPLLKTGKTVTINNKFNKPKPETSVRKNIVILDN
jgi:membrane-associated protease RseP (regulator of RpoE activity)